MLFRLSGRAFTTDRGEIMFRALSQKRGFTLIEVLIAMIVTILGVVFIWSAFALGTRFNAESEDKTVATNVTQHKMEEIINTRFRYITDLHPPTEAPISFSSETQGVPYWRLDSAGQWIPSLPEGEYEISYPDGMDADPLRVRVTVSWRGSVYSKSSLSVETLVSMTPGRFRSYN